MKRFLFWMVLAIVAVSWARVYADRQARVREHHIQREIHHLQQELRDYQARHDGAPPESRVDLAYQFPPPPAHAPREAYGDIPVPIVPGTRTTEAEIQPPRHRRPLGRPNPPPPPRVDRPYESRIPPPSPDVRTVTGRLSATPDRARDDARLMLERDVADWLEPDVPRSWKTPARLIDGLIVGTPELKTVEKDVGTLYEAAIRADFSPARRAPIVETYQRELVARRLAILGGILAFVLTCLAALAGYIRADEATKGYYTNHLRLAAAAGVGASGVVIYQLLT